MHISIGRVPLSLFIPAENLHERALARYREFAAESAESLPVFLRAGERTERDAAGFSYVLDEASMLLDSLGAEFRGVGNEYALDSLLRILLTMVLLPRRGFLLHAATVVRDGRAYVFAGRSGAGKSTVASLSPAGTVLTDEISLLRFTDGCWHAYGTPFWGEFRAAGMNEHYPIAGIYSLVQAPEDRAELMTTKEILRALLPCVLFFTAKPEANEALLRLLLGTVRQIPCYRLHFRRDAGFWKVVTA
ncbi:MAG: hypothetical protein ACRD59_13000 [Candidatus Acidiferrales bacterium]